jgi:NADH:ubiquinone reductase (H+-translocating)
MPQRPRVVIAGGGFGGLEAAKALRHAAVDVVLIDRENHHCFQPLLYQVATAALSPADVAWPIRSILRHQANASVLMAEVTGIACAAKQVITDAGPIPYDHLVLATGSTHSYFGHDEWAAAAPGLKRIEDATYIRRKILLAFERAEATQDEVERRRLLNFVVVGGGPTGVEMAGAIAEIARLTLADDFRQIDPRKARVILIEAGPRLLPALPDDLSDYAARALAQMDVDVLTGSSVTGCDDGGVTVADRRIEAATVIWAAGVVASPVARWLDVAADRAGRIEVSSDLSVPGRADIYAIGDVARVVDARGRLVPGVAPAAKQMGTYVGRLIAARVAGTAPPQPFRYRDYGMFATIGRRAAAARFGGLHLKGLIGWLTWCVAHVYFLIGMRNRFVVAFNWLWDYVTLQRGARLITETTPGWRPVAAPERKSVTAR